MRYWFQPTTPGLKRGVLVGEQFSAKGTELYTKTLLKYPFNKLKGYRHPGLSVWKYFCATQNNGTAKKTDKSRDTEGIEYYREKCRREGLLDVGEMANVGTPKSSGKENWIFLCVELAVLRYTTGNIEFQKSAFRWRNWKVFILEFRGSLLLTPAVGFIEKWGKCLGM